jgi:serine/threonine-protein kinase
MQLCPHCSTDLEDGARFCGACGKPIEASGPMPAPPPTPPAPRPGGPRKFDPFQATLLNSSPPPAFQPAAPGPMVGPRPHAPTTARPAVPSQSGSRPAPAAPPTQLGGGSGAAARQNVAPSPAVAPTLASPPSGVPSPAPAQGSGPLLPSQVPTAFPAGDGRSGAVTIRPPAKPAESFVGRTLNHRYVVQDKIGEGGFGAVFRGKQIATGREVALKILHPHNVSDATIVARFRREAEACSKLRDPHTVTTYDFDETEDGILYLVMELLRGTSLHLVQKADGPMPPARVLGILDQVAQSLGEAHQNGIVHRDMKPENIIIETRAGEDYVKVLDFGIAKVISGDKDAQALTAVGQTLGTLEFMSPEQLRGIKLDGRSDIYALGMMAYEMLTGELPFKKARTPIEIINFHMKDQPPPPSRMRPELKIPATIDEVLLRMVAKSRDDRYADTDELREAIADARKGRRRKGPNDKLDYRFIAALAGAGLVVVGAVLYFLFLRR